MKRYFIITIMISISMCLLATTAIPDIWYRPDSLVILQQEDSISWSDEYTVFTVVRSLSDSTAECLWSFAENDTVSAAVLTKGVYTSATGTLLSHHPHDFSKWCVYAYHSGINADSSKQSSFGLGERFVHVDSTITDTLHARIEMEEIAYFKGNVSRHVSHSFQTYLALKYGVTLDFAPYISQLGDTLWHPEHDEAFYHRVVGIGNDTIYHWESHVSQSKEDSLLVVRVDTVMPNEYIVMGDDNGSLEWERNLNDEYLIPRKWRIKQVVAQPKVITIAVRLSAIEDVTDSLRLAITDADGTLMQTLSPDSVIKDSVLYFTLNTAESLLQFQIKDVILHETHSVIEDTGNSQNGNMSDTNISFNANSQTIVVNGFPEEQLFELYLYDNLGRYFLSVTSQNPIDVKALPNLVSYIEIIADNQIVGAINIPTIIY